MKRLRLNLLLLLAALLSSTVMQAQSVLLSEEFESTEFPAGWSVDEACGDLENAYHWMITDISMPAGKHSAYHNGSNYSVAEPVHDDLLISPEIALDSDAQYHLTFLWKGATAASINRVNPEYDLQVRVRVVGGEWKTIWSFLSKEDVANSGVAFPWQAWENNSSSVDLSDFAGKKVQVAFAWCQLIEGKGKGNSAWIDNVVLEQYNAQLTPKAEFSMDGYSFSQVWMGSQRYSDAIGLTNNGRGTLRIKSISGLEGTDFSTTIDPSEVALAKMDTYQFNIIYEPTLMGKGSATLHLELEEGDAVDFHISGTKRILPDGYNYEGFEGTSFPPVGWTNNGWYPYGAGISGNRCAMVGLAEDGCLISPRLDLSGDEEYKIYFTFEDQFDPDNSEVAYPDNYFCVYLSTDGGKTWGETNDDKDYIFWNEEEYNQVVSKEISLGTPHSDNCLVKFRSFFIDGLDLSDYDNIPDYSLTYIDDVVLPPYYGANDKPKATRYKSPVNGVVDQNTKGITLAWNEVIFAQEYKVFVGTTPDATEIVNGESVPAGTTTYVLPKLENSTQYYWRVVPSNAAGDAEGVETWSFTTIGDTSVKEFPYFQGFDESSTMPGGWVVETTHQYVKWNVSDSGYEGKNSAFAGGSYIGQTTLETPEFQFPEDSKPVISFWWGNGGPSILKKDPLGQQTNNTEDYNGIDACYFEVEDATAEGGWKTLALLSDRDNEYWVRENVDISAYAGQKVAFRFRYIIGDGTRNHGVSLDNIEVEIGNNCLAYFNVSQWEAGKVNYNSTEDAQYDIALANGGIEELTVESATFKKKEFTTTLKAGDIIPGGKPSLINITFQAGQTTGRIEDALTVTFTNGQTVTLPVSATVLEPDMLYFNFEHDEFGSTTVNNFTTIDADHAATVPPTFIYYPHRGEAFAYIVIDVRQDYADWRNVYPVSGNKVLASMRDTNNGVENNDWLISPQLEATADSKFRFYAKSYGNTDQFDLHSMNIMVSTTNANTSSFEAVQENVYLPYSAEGEWTEFEYDLSKYAGQKIYVAIQNVSSRNSFVSFFDDLTFEHFKNAYEIVGEMLMGDANNDGKVTMSDANLIVNFYINGLTSDINLDKADVTGDNIITMADANQIVNIYVSNEAGK